MDARALASRDPLVVAGIDPGSRVLGYGVVARSGEQLIAVDHGAFRAPNGRTLSERLGHLGQKLGALFAHHRPHVIAIERAFVRTNPQSALRLGEARGVVLLKAAEAGVPVLEYTAPAAKKCVTGYGQAEKDAVAEGVRELLQLAEVPRPLDATDALALALCLLADPAVDPRFADHLAP